MNLKWKYKLIYKALTLSTLLGLALTGCTKKRDPELSYGADRDLYAMADYKDKNFDLETSEVTAKPESLKSYSVEKEGESSKVSAFGFVKFAAKDPLKLLSDSQFLAKAQSKYVIRYDFQNDLLKVLKVGPRELFSQDEITSLTDMGQNQWAVPVVAYSVEYFRMDQKRNDNNEKTSKLELIPVQNVQAATHFRIDLKSKRTASFIAKTTVLPVSFFRSKEDINASREDKTTSEKSDWYVGLSVISSNSFNKDSRFNGMIGAFDKFEMPAGRTRLYMTEKGLNFVNVSLDERVVSQLNQKAEQRSSVLFIPSEFKDFKFNDQGRNTGVKEETLREKSWKDRQFIELKLEDIIVAGGADPLKVSEILDLNIEEGYLSFEILDQAHDARMRVSLYNVSKYKKDQAQKWDAKEYIAKKYWPQDQKAFGFFKTQNYVAKEAVSTVEDDPRVVPSLVRFNPDRSFIEYRLSKDSPEWMEEIFTEAMKSWNQALDKAGVRFRIKFQDEQGKALRGTMGDLRYNLVQIMDTLVESQRMYGGFGPSISDPQGEIIMATTVLDTEGTRQAMERLVQRYLRLRQTNQMMGNILSFTVDAANSLSPLKVNTGAQSFSLRKGVDPILNSLVQLKVYNVETGMIETLKKQSLDSNSNPWAVKDQQEFSSRSFEMAGAVVSATELEIQNLCPDLLQVSSTDLEALANIGQKQPFKNCLLTLMKPRLLSTLLHEVGHNLGLRHNFAASSDIANFYKPVEAIRGGKKTLQQWSSSSVMDYLMMADDVLSAPGSYDIAAIQWAYVDRVQKTDGQVVKIDSSKSLQQQLGEVRRPFRYCTDEDMALGGDPFCAQYDIGYDPKLVIRELIKNYEEAIRYSGFRNGILASGSAEELAAYRAQRFLAPMLKFYQSWRFLLLKETGVEKSYLEGVTTNDDYQKILNQLFSSEKYGPAMARWHRSFYEASREAFDFLVRIVLTPDLSCVATKMIENEKQYQLYPFSKIQRAIFDTKKITVLNCDQAEVRDYLLEEKQADYVKAVGISYAPIYSDLSETLDLQTTAERKWKRPEFVGIANDRFMALQILVNRGPLSLQAARMAFVPNFTDEPPFREKLATLFIERVIHGVPLSNLALAKSGEKTEKYAPIFSTERSLLQYLIIAMKQAISVAGKDAVNNSRLAPYSAKPRFRFDRNESIRCVRNSATGDLCAAKKYKEAVKIIEKIDEIEDVRAQWYPETAAIEKVKAAIQKYFPKKGQGLELAPMAIYQIRMEIEAIGNKNPKLSEDMAKIIDRIFNGDENIFYFFAKEKLKEIDDKSEAKSFEEKEKLKEPYYRKPMVQWYSLLRPGDFEVLEEYEYYSQIKSLQDYKGLDQDQGLARVDQLLNKLAGWKQSYANDPSDWDAKGDILLNSLMSSW